MCLLYKIFLLLIINMVLNNSKELDILNLITLNSNGELYLNAKYFLKCVDYTYFIQYMLELINKSLQHKRLYKQRETIIMNLNFKDTTSKNVDHDFIKTLIQFLEKTYPNKLERMVFHNVPFMFKMIYKLIRPCIDKETRAKFVFIKTQKNIPPVSLTEAQLEDLFDEDDIDNTNTMSESSKTNNNNGNNGKNYTNKTYI